MEIHHSEEENNTKPVCFYQLSVFTVAIISSEKSKIITPHKDSVNMQICHNKNLFYQKGFVRKMAQTLVDYQIAILISLFHNLLGFLTVILQQ